VRTFFLEYSVSDGNFQLAPGHILLLGFVCKLTDPFCRWCMRTSPDCCVQPRHLH